ncbi:nuclear transport factor 2 family protein [Novosphingobium panipatense]|uniref:nuclear transport factor 2 family protein n=1 Tax=Novosphingobium panipatense TaxID=428991 RepID=UPI0039A25DC2
MDANAFATAWVEAWNRRDVEAVLEHFHEEVLFSSPLAAELLPETRGVVRGKPALRRYWTEALKRNPYLHFTIEAVHQGVAALVVTYRTEQNVTVAEVLLFDGDRISEGHAAHPVVLPTI